MTLLITLNISLWKIFNHVNIDCGNSLFLVFNYVGGYIIKEKDEKKYLTFASTDKTKEVFEKYSSFGTESKIKLKK